MNATEFLEKFYAGTKFKIELRTFKPSENGKRGPVDKRIFSRDMAELADFIDQRTAKGENVYFGICTRDGVRHEGSKTLGGKVNCREVTAFWMDMDVDGADALAAALERIRAFRPEPSIIIFSGGGFHVYWLLSEPIDAQDARVEPILEGLTAALGADPSCAELARVLRPPGTKNFKPEYGTPQDVELMRADWDRRYRVEDFAACAATRTAHGINPPEDSTNGKIPQGKRYDWLLSRAGGYRRRGDSEAEIIAKLKIDLDRCDKTGWDELPLDAIEQIARGIGDKPVASDAPAITVRIGEMPAAVDEAEAALLPHAQRLCIFQRAGELTQVIRLPEARKSAGLMRPKGDATTATPHPRRAARDVRDRRRIPAMGRQGQDHRRGHLPAHRLPGTHPANLLRPHRELEGRRARGDRLCSDHSPRRYRLEGTRLRSSNDAVLRIG